MDIYYSILIFVIALLLVCYSTKKVIYIAHKKHLFDEPSEDRKIHRVRTPNLGGVAIFASLMFTFFIFLPLTSITHLNYIVASSVIIFIIGLTDDLVGVNPTKKFAAQFIVAVIITGPAGFRFTDFYGLMGLHQIPMVLSMPLSVLFIVLLINAFNLIDGINCLAGSIGLLCCAAFAYLFWSMNETGYMFLAAAMCGCLAGFLIYNRTPARIFMGDTGSLFLGFMIAVFSIHFVELNKNIDLTRDAPVFRSAPVIVFALLIIPLFDTLRVFLIRTINRKSPFTADRNHIHHRLIDLKFSHMQSTGILLMVNIIAVMLVFIFSGYSNEIIFSVVISFTLSANWLLSLRFNRKVARFSKPSHSFPGLATY